MNAVFSTNVLCTGVGLLWAASFTLSRMKFAEVYNNTVCPNRPLQ